MLHEQKVSFVYKARTRTKEVIYNSVIHKCTAIHRQHTAKWYYEPGKHVLKWQTPQKST